MAKNFSGRDYLLYVKTSAPAVGDEIAGYTKVGFLTALSLGRSRAAMDKSNKDDGDDSTFVAGRRVVTVSGAVVYDHTIEAGQDLFSDAYESSAGLLWFLLTSVNSGDQEIHGNGIVTDWSVTFDDEGISTASFSVQGSGTLTEVTGT